MSIPMMQMSGLSTPALSRIHTAPTMSTRQNGIGGSGPYSAGSGSNVRSSQLSGSTAVSLNSTTSLSSLNSTVTLVPGVQATNNIINQRADESRSLYQICMRLRQRLGLVPGFDQFLREMEEEDGGQDMIEPVSSLWRCLRKGIPLMTIYNVLQPAEPLKIDEGTVPERNRPKRAAFNFVNACLKDLKLPSGECFVLTDLFGDDTTGFVKVTQVINRVLDIAEKRGLLLTQFIDSAATGEVAGGKLSYRDHVVRELVNTERKYVQDLENLHELKKVIEQKAVIAGDVVHDIFLNINAILDFQRRFLIRIETTNSQPDARQEWGTQFKNYEDAFGIYQPFIANQRKAAAIAKREFDKIALANHPVVVDFNTLDAFLLKPMQRLVKYPLLLKDLRDKTGANEATQAELNAGIEASNRVLQQANAAVDRELRAEALDELCLLVEDWKNHEVGQFGELLLHGQFTVTTGKSDVEKEYTIYLFERILLCCKEVVPNKQKDKLIGQKEKKDKKDKDKKKGEKGPKTAKLQLKGRIFMTNVTDILSLLKPGSYTVQIWWKGDPGVESFVIRMPNEEVMKKWSTALDTQRNICAADQKAQSAASAEATPEFYWTRNQTAAMPNPYAQQDDDDDDENGGPVESYGGQSTWLPRNASSNSLRSRSTTGESTQSLAGMVRQQPPQRFPTGFQNQQLSLQTQLQGPATAPMPGDSYFSPVGESPASSRTSQASSVFPFPRQGTPQGGWEDHNRYTAPAIPRAPSRESQGPPGNYSRNPQRPSLPPPSHSSQGSISQQRSRSYSTPDVNGLNGSTRRLTNGAASSAVPAVPGIPPHLHPAYDAGIPRSNSNSPSNLPVRSSTQSPGAQRERLMHQNSQYGAPQYTRSNTTQIPSSAMDGRTMSPPLPHINDMPPPTQLKVKVNCDGNYVTLVVAFSITYQSLIDRIDAKVGRFSNNAIARGTMRLRYQDEDGDYVTIESDDDIQIAFQEWRDSQRNQFHTGLGEIELFCASVES